MTYGEGAVLVTGATGSVGRFVVSSLTDRGVPVRQAVTEFGAGGSGDQVRFDFADPGTWGVPILGSPTERSLATAVAATSAS